MKLSILICSLDNRVEMLQNLMSNLEKQKTEEIEILINTDNGIKSIGKKRNELVEKSKGDYACFVDDDDNVATDYCDRILKAVQTNPDCCGLEGQITFSGINPKKFIHSITCDSWCEKNGIYYRSPNHLNPIKTDIIKKVLFKEINYYEDRDFSSRVKQYLKTEVYIKGLMYYYYYNEKKHSSK